MKRLCKDIDITDRDLIRKATYKCLKGKYMRNDVVELFANISNINKQEIRKIYAEQKHEGMKPFVEKTIDLVRSELLNENISFPPIWYKDKIDVSSRKERRIGIQNIKQQIYDYVAVEGLKPLLKRIGNHQYASIKTRGQIAGAKQIQRWLRNKNIKYFAKLDVYKCYPNINHIKLLNFLRKHIKNNKLLWLIEELLASFKTGLSIGSYLSQFLCNLYLSLVYHFIGNQHHLRKRKNGHSELIPLVHHRLLYMDDIFIMGTSSKNIHKAVRLIIEYCKSLGLTIKENWFVRKMVFDRSDNFSFIDIMGFKIYRNFITIRKRVFKRIRHIYMKVYKLWKTHQKILICFARKCISYNGLLKNSNSFKVMKKYHVDDVLRICKKVVKNNNESKVFYRTATC